MPSKEAIAALNKTVTWIDKYDGIQFRAHREDPDKFVVVKIHKDIPGLTQAETKDILVAYLASNNMKPPGGIIKGSIKWIAIMPKKELEQKAGVKVKANQDVQVSAAQMATAIASSGVNLDNIPGVVTAAVKKPQFQLGSGEEKAPQYQHVTQLEQAFTGIRDNIREAKRGSFRLSKPKR